MVETVNKLKKKTKKKREECVLEFKTKGFYISNTAQASYTILVFRVVLLVIFHELQFLYRVNFY